MKHRHSAAFLLPCLLLLFALATPAAAVNINVNQDTFVISDEAPGFLIAKLINAGHGGDNLYQATVYLAGMPGAGAVLTPAFLNALATCPAGSEIFTTTLAQIAAQGVSVSISTDGTARYDTLEGRVWAGTYPVIQTGNGTIQNVRIVHSTDSAATLNTTVIAGPLAGMTTSYKAFAIAWAVADPPPATPAPPTLWLAAIGCLALLGYALWSRRRAVLLPIMLVGLFALASPARAASYQTFVLSNEGSSGFVSQLLSGGYGNFNLYNTLVQIQSETDPSVSGIVTPAFLATLQSCPPSSAIFTTQLKNVGVGSQGVAVSTDCTVQTVNISGRAVYSGNNTLGATVTGVGLAYFTSSPGATPLTSFNSGGNTYNVFGIGWMAGTTPPATPAPPTFWLAAIGCLALGGWALRSRRHECA